MINTYCPDLGDLRGAELVAHPSVNSMKHRLVMFLVGFINRGSQAAQFWVGGRDGLSVFSSA